MNAHDTRPKTWHWVALLILCSPALGESPSHAAGALQATAKPSIALVKREKIAAQTLARIANLQSQAQASIVAAQAVSEAGRASQRLLLAQQTADQRLRAALQTANACPPELQTRVTDMSGVMTSAQNALGQSHAAVQAIAQATGPSLASAAQAADGAFAQRGAAESALQRALVTLQATESRCRQLTASARWDQQDNEASAQQLMRRARGLLERRQTAIARWNGTQAAFEAAARARHLKAPTAQPMPTADREVIALARALVRPAPAPSAPSSSTAALDGLTPLWTALIRLQDASAYIGTQLAADDCPAETCAAFKVEQRELALRTVRAQERLHKTMAQWLQAPDALSRSLEETKVRQATLANAVDTLARSLIPAVAQTRDEAQAIADNAQPLLRAARTAHANAQRRWEAAYRLAYGANPVQIERAFSIASGSEPMSAPPPSAMISAPDIRDHAYDLFSEFDGEIEGFGAYTYVVVKSAADMQSPPVRRRFERLLGTLQALPQAASVDSDLTQHFNVFCVPVVPGNEQAIGPEGVQYASDLGQQLKMRAQSGLLTQASVRHRLGNSSGPFLITLPTRLSKAQSSTPVLIADLSTYSEEAIADLATQYMNGLVDDFPSQQALWKPPVLQRVALFMIHMAEGTGQLITSAMPTAQAATTPP